MTTLEDNVGTLVRTKTIAQRFISFAKGGDKPASSPPMNQDRKPQVTFISPHTNKQKLKNQPNRPQVKKQPKSVTKPKKSALRRASQTQTMVAEQEIKPELPNPQQPAKSIEIRRLPSTSSQSERLKGSSTTDVTVDEDVDVGAVGDGEVSEELVKLRKEVKRLKDREKVMKAKEKEWKKLATMQQEELEHFSSLLDQVNHLRSEVAERDQTIKDMKLQVAFSEWMRSAHKRRSGRRKNRTTSPNNGGAYPMPHSPMHQQNVMLGQQNMMQPNGMGMMMVQLPNGQMAMVPNPMMMRSQPQTSTSHHHRSSEKHDHHRSKRSGSQRDSKGGQSRLPNRTRPPSSKHKPLGRTPTPEEYPGEEPTLPPPPPPPPTKTTYEEYVQELAQPPPDLPPIKSNIVVAVRCRPLSKREFEESHCDIVKMSEGRNARVEVRKATGADLDYLAAKRVQDKDFTFDRTYGGTACSQVDVYNGVVSDLVERVLSGENATVFAYGATGSGKTYTMLGSPEDPGVIVLAMKDLFAQAVHIPNISVEVTFLEVYCEQIKDLLSPPPQEDTPQKVLEVRETKEGVLVPGLTAIPVTSAEMVMDKLHNGNKRRTVRSTNSNEVSSRSHAVFQVRVKVMYATGPKVSTLSMIDLAGSERLKKSEVAGVGQAEATRINQSLLSLGNCITKLAAGGKHVPYRDSKLTRLLQESLQGNCRTVMIAAVSPSHKQVEETLNTLKYADRAKNIQTLVQKKDKPTMQRSNSR